MNNFGVLASVLISVCAVTFFFWFCVFLVAVDFSQNKKLKNVQTYMTFSKKDLVRYVENLEKANKNLRELNKAYITEPEIIAEGLNETYKIIKTIRLSEKKLHECYRKLFESYQIGAR